MIGSGKNVDLANILIGAPVAEDVAGNVRLANTTNRIAFALATTGAAVGGVVSWQTDGLVSRDDWTALVGTKYLTPGSRYFVSGTGKLSLAGSQQVGVAKSRTEIRIEPGSSSGSSSSSGGEVAAETAARIAADNVLTSALAVEVTNRTAADAVLQSEIAALSGSGIIENVVASEDIPAFTAVTVLGARANSANTAHYAKVFGVALAAIASGFSGAVMVNGPLTNSSWSWTTGAPVYLNGTALSMTAASTGFSQQIALAANTDRLQVALLEPVLL